MTDRLRWLFLVLLASAVGAFHGWIKPDFDREQIKAIEEYFLQTTLWQDRYPPDFELPLLDGESFSLADRVGQEVIILNFFATWCAPCRAEMPELDRFYRAHADEGLLLLGVDVAEDRELVETFVDELELSFPVALDQHAEVSASYQAETFPTTVVIGLDGRVQIYQIGAISNAEIAFGEAMARNRQIAEDGGRISKPDYLAALAAQPPLDTGGDQEPQLAGRALEIAEAMPCPCGCAQKVRACGCGTADRIQNRLAEMDLGDRTDMEIMQELNKEFCVGAES